MLWSRGRYDTFAGSGGVPHLVSLIVEGVSSRRLEDVRRAREAGVADLSRYRSFQSTTAGLLRLVSAMLVSAYSLRSAAAFSPRIFARKSCEISASFRASWVSLKPNRG